MKKTKIEWTDSTWNPVRGCTRVSEGCRHCYAERIALRIAGPGDAYEGLVRSSSTSAHGAQWTNKLSFPLEVRDQPLRWQKPKMIFVNSMSDLFHEKIPFEFIDELFGIMKRADWHKFQILTKRAERMLEYWQESEWPKHVWPGVSVEDATVLNRVQLLSLIKGPEVRFVSVEPLIAPIDNLPLDRIDWAIVGGESGPGAREMKREWVISIKKQCERAGVPFFFKQWGGANKDYNGRRLDGLIYDAIPVVPDPSPTQLELF